MSTNCPHCETALPTAVTSAKSAVIRCAGCNALILWSGGQITRATKSSATPKPMLGGVRPRPSEKTPTPRIAPTRASTTPPPVPVPPPAPPETVVQAPAEPPRVDPSPPADEDDEAATVPMPRVEAGDLTERTPFGEPTENATGDSADKTAPIPREEQTAADDERDTRLDLDMPTLLSGPPDTLASPPPQAPATPEPPAAIASAEAAPVGAADVTPVSRALVMPDRARGRWWLIAAGAAAALAVAGLLAYRGKPRSTKPPAIVSAPASPPDLALVPSQPPPAPVISPPKPAITTAPIASQPKTKSAAKLTVPAPSKRPPARAPTPAPPTKRRAAAGPKAAPATKAHAAPQKPAAESAAAAQVLIRQGNERLFAGDAAGAIRAYQEATRAAPQLASAYRSLGMAYEKSGDKRRARDAFHRYLKGAPKAPDREAIKKRIAALR